MTQKTLTISFNAPVILTLTFSALTILGLSFFSIYFETKILRWFTIYHTSWLDPYMYLRIFTHILGHYSVGHFVNNFMMILIIGPIIEEKYGSKHLLMMILVTTLITGLIHIYYFPKYALLGSSSIVFMLILLASFSNVRSGSIPLTFILVGILYLGNEIVNGIMVDDNISRMAHVIGGLCGAIFGFIFKRSE